MGAAQRADLGQTPTFRHGGAERDMRGLTNTFRRSGTATKKSNKDQAMWLGLNAILEHAQIAPMGITAWTIERILLDTELERAGPTEVRSLQIIEKVAWGRSFEEIRARLHDDGRAYIEGDGSFVLCGNEACTVRNRQTVWCGQLPSLLRVVPTVHWREPNVENPLLSCVWRIEGNLCDGANGLDSISLNGWAPWSEWQRLFELLGPVFSSAAPVPPRCVLQMHHFGTYFAVKN
ncbi:MAG: hypothetical protein Q8M16_24365 [Pirellulaceae bacterium]|nr:hypothetical protein [Pirellulaceae bacterium]